MRQKFSTPRDILKPDEGLFRSSTYFLRQWIQWTPAASCLQKPEKPGTHQGGVAYPSCKGRPEALLPVHIGLRGRCSVLYIVSLRAEMSGRNHGTLIMLFGARPMRKYLSIL